MKNLISILVVLLLTGCTTTKYVFIDPKDSTKLVEIKKRVIYDDLYYSAPMLSSPLWWDWNYRFRQPIIVNPRPIIVNPRPRIENPKWRPTPLPNRQGAPIRRFNNK